MFEIESYLHNPCVLIENIDVVNKYPEKFFVNINDNDSIERIKKDIDTNYFEGVICIKYFGEAILDFKYWDSVDQLWAYIVNLIEEYMENSQSETYFPDQSIKIAFKNVSKELILLTLSNDDHEFKWKLPRKELLESLLESAELFFKKIVYYFDNLKETYLSETTRIANLRKKL